MKRKIIFVNLALLIALIVSVSAVGFSPTSLVFNLSPNQKDCKNISIESNSDEIALSDFWAENKDVEWGITRFNTTSNYHGISMGYPKSLGVNERVVEVCLSGSNPGEYHGVLLLKQGQEGNSVVQLGIWLKLTVSGQETKTQQVPVENVTREVVDDNKVDNVKGSITGSAVGAGNNSYLFIFGIVGIAAIVVGIVIYTKLKNPYRWAKKYY